jgi:hypothetical protein
MSITAPTASAAASAMRAASSPALSNDSEKPYPTKVNAAAQPSAPMAV